MQCMVLSPPTWRLPQHMTEVDFRYIVFPPLVKDTSPDTRWSSGRSHFIFPAHTNSTYLVITKYNEEKS